MLSYSVHCLNLGLHSECSGCECSCHTVSQDGANFYNGKGALIFKSTTVVKDMDLPAAKKARQEFLAWANRDARFRNTLKWAE